MRGAIAAMNSLKKIASVTRLGHSHHNAAQDDVQSMDPMPAESTGGVGTVLYQAPEILREKGGNIQSDVYSFGIMLYEIAKVMPFGVKYDTPFQVTQHAERILTGWRPEIPPRWDMEWARLITTCWQEDASKRPTFKASASVRRCRHVCLHCTLYICPF